MNLKFHELEKGNVFDAICGIYYAVDNGADIINMSIAGKWFSYNAEVTRAVENARNNNVIVVISA